MIDFGLATVVFAGNSTTTVAREFIVRAGTSVTENRDYIVVLKRNYLHTTAVVLVVGNDIRISNFGRLSTISSVLDVRSSLLSLSPFPARDITAATSIINVSSGLISISRLVSHVTSSIAVTSYSVNLLYNRLWNIEQLVLILGSGEAIFSSFTATVSELRQSYINVNSGYLTVDGSDKLTTTAVFVASGFLYTAYDRIVEIPTHSLGISSSISVLERFAPVILEATSSTVQVLDGELSTAIYKYASSDTSIVNVSSSNTSLDYTRIMRAAPLLLGALSGSGNLLFTSLSVSAIDVRSTTAILGYRTYAEHAVTIINVKSSDAHLRNPYLVALSGIVRAVSASGELRHLPDGYLPSTAPTNRTFQPPRYKIEKIGVLSGRTVRQIVCSAPSYALLTLEYTNISDYVAEDVLSAYDSSYGQRFGFKLPSLIVAGAGNDLIDYIRLSSSKLRWYYSERPSMQSVTKGICNLTVALRAGLEVP